MDVSGLIFLFSPLANSNQSFVSFENNTFNWRATAFTAGLTAYTRRTRIYYVSVRLRMFVCGRARRRAVRVDFTVRHCHAHVFGRAEYARTQAGFFRFLLSNPSTIRVNDIIVMSRTLSFFVRDCGNTFVWNVLGFKLLRPSDIFLWST